jgi:radical SAM protein with 4Fe4S-binding SPASM domain
MSSDIPITLFISLTKKLVQEIPGEELIDYAISLGIKYIQFERITLDGNAKDSEILAENKHIDMWFVKLFEATKKRELYSKIGNMFFSELANAVVNANHIGNRCRNCERSIITINADGTLSGCPNSAKEQKWGNISNGSREYVESPGRLKAISKEVVRESECLTCDVREICNGDCYKLRWDENCPAPKELMRILKNEETNLLEKLKV